MISNHGLKYLLLTLLWVSATFANEAIISCTFNWYDCRNHPETPVFNVLQCQDLGRQETSFFSSNQPEFTKYLYYSTVDEDLFPITIEFSIKSAKNLETGEYFYNEKGYDQQYKGHALDEFEGVSYKGSDGHTYAMGWECSKS